MKTIGFAVCGSFCTFKTIFEEVKRLKKLDYNIIPIMSENSFDERIEFDLRYNEKPSIIDDCAILIKTVISVTKKEGAI